MRESRLPAFFRKMKRRTRAGLNCLHYLHANGKYYCLDLNLSQPTLEDLISSCGELLVGIGDGAILPAMDEPQWMQLKDAEYLGRGVLPFRFGSESIIYVLLKGEFRE